MSLSVQKTELITQLTQNVQMNVMYSGVVVNALVQVFHYWYNVLAQCF